MTSAATALERFVRGIEAEGLGAHGVHVLIADDEASHRWAPDERADIHSAAKGVCVIAAGIAADEGLFDLDAPVVSYLPDFAVGEGVDAVTARHLLTMTSGIDLTWTPTLFDDWPDLAREFLSRPAHGRVSQYANASTYTAMRALGAVVGDVRDWLVPRLFEPLGIDDPQWDRCPNGWIKAGEGLHLRTSELARIGRLIRDRGEWRGTRLVGAQWIDAMHSDWIDTGGSPGYDRYALSGWAGPGDAWRLHGAYGQLLVFSGNAVVTVTADEHDGGYRMAELAVDAVRA
ncbi:serine hydrolase domain-containing protein [Microbacterium stercoris]|uniref:Beta-lactamase family protein n=1 Tax=Microbacterium stercoris TaxID=2820289 RepID=A0A939TYX7_9MICO|nr:serine hydrolase domain-containing protein [Microbacterium stercoris]MBO3665162.1 beta-lactamase family protein [Microbacterium stercoris]